MPSDSSTVLLGFRTTRKCHQAKTIQSIQFIYASQEPAVCDELELINPRLVKETQALPFLDFYCTDEMLLELEQVPYIENYEDRHLTPAMEKFYAVLGVLMLVIIILSICLYFAKSKVK